MKGQYSIELKFKLYGFNVMNDCFTYYLVLLPSFDDEQLMIRFIPLFLDPIQASDLYELPPIVKTTPSRELIMRLSILFIRTSHLLRQVVPPIIIIFKKRKI